MEPNVNVWSELYNKIQHLKSRLENLKDTFQDEQDNSESQNDADGHPSGRLGNAFTLEGMVEDIINNLENDFTTKLIFNYNQDDVAYFNRMMSEVEGNLDKIYDRKQQDDVWKNLRYISGKYEDLSYISGSPDTDILYNSFVRNNFSYLDKKIKYLVEKEASAQNTAIEDILNDSIIKKQAIDNLALETKNTQENLRKIYADLQSYSERDKNRASAEAYDDLYRTEKIVADTFRKWTIGVFSVLAAIAVICLTYLIFPGLYGSQLLGTLTDPELILFKIPYLITILVFGFYLARESEKHRRLANQAHQTAAELFSLHSYTLGWDPKRIEDLKDRLADKYFGKSLYDSSKPEKAADVLESLAQQAKVMNELVSSIQSTVESLKGKDQDKNK